METAWDATKDTTMTNGYAKRKMRNGHGEPFLCYTCATTAWAPSDVLKFQIFKSVTIPLGMPSSGGSLTGAQHRFLQRADFQMNKKQQPNNNGGHHGGRNDNDFIQNKHTIPHQKEAKKERQGNEG